MQNNPFKKESYIEYILITILFLLPILSFAGYQLSSFEAYDEWRILEIIQLSVLIAFLAFKKSLLYYLVDNTTLIKKMAFIIVVILSGLSCLHSMYPLRALSDFALLFGLTIALFPLSYIFSKNKKIREQLLIVMSFSHTLFIIILTTQILTSIATNDFEAMQLWCAQFYLARMYGDIMLIIVPLIYATISLVPQKYRPLVYIYLIISHTLLFLSGGRAQLLSLVLSTFIIYTLNKSYRDAIKEYACLIFLSFAIYFIVTASSGYGNLASTSSHGRVDIYLIALRTSLDHLFLGVGGDHFSLLKGISGSSTDFPVAHPHSLPLQIITEYGWPVFILILALLLPSVKTWLTTVTNLPKNQYNNASEIYVFLSISLLSSILNSFVSGNHVYPLSQLFIFTTIALICSYHISHKEIDTEKHYNHSLIYINTALRLLITIFLCTFIYLSYLKSSCHQYAILTQPNFAEMKNPRFWFFGQARLEKICYDRQH